LGKRIQTTFRIDYELLHRLRHALVERERKMTPVIEELIREWLHEYELKGQQENEITRRVKSAVAVEVQGSEVTAPRVTQPLVGAQAAEVQTPGSPQPPVSAELTPNAEPDPPNMLVQHGHAARVPWVEVVPRPYSDWDAAAQLNPRYTFDSFVIGAGNQFAHAACQAVAERPSKAYNPLFLYGGVGMGKTHLMQAIGHEIKRRTPQAAVYYASSEKFTNEMINSLRYDKMISFRDKFRTTDVLLIDDIQFLAQKERTQEEFFHTFNALHESMKQIVIASDRPPKSLEEFEDRLRNRFEWGLIADIQPPDLETKLAILQKKADQEKTNLPTDVALFIASNGSNVRELEGALIRLVAHSCLTDAEITLPYAQAVLKNFIDSLARKVTIESIQKSVAAQFGLRLPEIKAKNNSRSIVYPRQIAMYLAKHLTEASLPEIGRQFGGKHGTTVLHSVDKIEEIRKIDKDLNRLLNKLTEELGA
jgi:chromosomal replication initiator protein